jgi:type I restriction-modification system DNA methylase subunit
MKATKAPPRISPAVIDAAARAAVLVAHEITGRPQLWQDAIQHTIRALIHRLADARGLPEPALPYCRLDEAEEELDSIGKLADWTIHDLGDINQELLRLHLVTDGRTLAAVKPAGQSQRDVQGSWYTPQPLAREMTRLALDIAIDQCLKVDDPEQILRLQAVDPACGAGVFLIEAARKISEAYVSRLTTDGSTPPELVALVLPMVTYECVYGMDIDPVAVDLARTALWLEVGGSVPFAWLDGNVACVNPLAGPNSLPERLLDVMGEPPPFEHDAA